jgi:hypothetical protein
MDVNSISSSTAALQATASNNSSKPAKENAKPEKETGVVYDKTVDRDAIIEQMKKDSENQHTQLANMVRDMMSQQGQQLGNADDMWKFLAGGNFTVTAAAKEQAQKAISEDGYYGIEQTSERIVEFAKVLTGGDTSKIDEMRKAFEKGFKEATKSWGKELPSISKDTYDAVMKKFDDWANADSDSDASKAQEAV